MPTENPLSVLHRRLQARPGPVGDGDAEDGTGEAAEDADPVPDWLPDPGSRPRSWLAAIRADPGRSGGIALAVVALLAVLVTVFTLARHRPPPVVSADLPPVEMVSTAAARPSQPAPAEQAVVVSVVGLVAQPGLVTLAPNARVSDAVSAAGGPLDGADTLGLNLARHLADGEQIVIGIATPAGRSAALGSSVGGTGPAPSGPGPSGPAPSGPAPSGPAVGTTAPSGPVDLNTATAEQLDALPGIGPVTAAAIVNWRAANGGFTSVEQLAEVDGIGPARLEKLRPMVRV